MRLNYKPLGNYIKPLDERNKELLDLPLMGLSVSKLFFPTIANLVGTDMSTYKIVYRNQFTYIADTSRRGDKIAIALNEDFEKMLVSQAYTPFEVKKTNELLPEYLMMWFRRPEFDRYARFKSHGSAREIFDWEEMSNLLLPVPSLEKQKKMVAEYTAVQGRINLNMQLIEKLEETAQAVYKSWFVDFEFLNENGKPYKSNGGEMVESELGEIPRGWGVKTIGKLCDVKGGKRLPKNTGLNDEKDGRPYIKVADMSDKKFIVLNERFEFVNEEIRKSISKYTVSENDVIISIVGTVGLVNIIDKSLHNANLTENCFKLTNLKVATSDYLFYFLTSSLGKNIIETKTVGGVQAKLPMYNVQSIPILLPNQGVIDKFNSTLIGINDLQKAITLESAKLEELKYLLLSKLATTEN